jgi:dTMP kinase
MFIVITGGDQCGKTTQCGLLAGRLREHGAKVFEAKVPDGDTPIGRDIRRLMRGARTAPPAKDDQRILEALFVVDRALTEKRIIKAESEGQIVVCSRWVESAYVYAQSLGFDEKWHEILVSSSKIPDLSIMIDVPSSVYEERASLTRITGLGALDSYDRDVDLQHKVRAALRGFTNVARVDGSKSASEVAESVWKVVVTKLLSLATARQS